MTKKLIIIFTILAILIICICGFIFLNKEKPIYLEDDYYGSSEIKEIDFDELNNLIDNEKSFAVFVYQPLCFTSADFESILNKFVENNKITIYKITFSSIKNTKIGKKIKYYPSFMIYNEGKMVDFLEADKDKDVKLFTEEEEFTKWFTKYIKLK